jgi:uncharacterized membrane protein
VRKEVARLSSKAAITINRPREMVERLWRTSEYRPEYIEASDAAVTFADAPGDRGTEIHVDLESAASGGKLGALPRKLMRGPSRAKAMDDLRRFKQLVETGVIARSDATPEGELAERKLKQRPAQPLSEAELEKAGVS